MAYFTLSPQSNINSNQWSPSPPPDGRFDTRGCLTLSAILSIVFVVLLISIHVYARYRREYTTHTIEIYQSHPPPHPQAVAVSQGLAAAVIAALPTFLYSRPQCGSAEDCAVCLCSPEEGEVVKMLPDCKHLFHAGCIDMWLRSHSTCPVCRRETKPVAIKLEFGMLLASPRFSERFVLAGGGGVGSDSADVRPKEGSSESQWSPRRANGTGRWVATVDGEYDLERQ